SDGRVDAFRRTIDPGALRAVEGQFLAVHREEVLPEILAERFEEITEAADDGIVPPDRVFRLRDVDEIDGDDGEGEAANADDEECRHDVDDLPDHGAVKRIR